MKAKQETEVHWGNYIYQYCKANRYTLAAVARKLNMSKDSFTSLLKRPTMQVSRFVSLSKALNYNFVMDLALDLKIETHKPNEELEKLKVQLAQQTAELERLRTENALMRDLLQE